VKKERKEKKIRKERRDGPYHHERPKPAAVRKGPRQQDDADGEAECICQ
jgi:hypothetical protein